VIIDLGATPGGVRRDLVRSLKQPDRGRRGLAAPQVSRALVLMRVKN
jgi:hypothetical protein